MNIEKGLEREKCRLLHLEHVLEAMDIVYALADYGPNSTSPIDDKVSLINAAQSLVKKMEVAERKHLLSRKKLLAKAAREEAKKDSCYFSKNRGQL